MKGLIGDDWVMGTGGACSDGHSERWVMTGKDMVVKEGGNGSLMGW